jgi:hypothetical protein
MVKQSDLETIRGYIARADARIAEQEARIERLAEAHQSTDLAESLLQILRDGLDASRTSLAVLEDDKSADIAHQQPDDTWS